MILLIKKRSFHLLFVGIFFLGISLGTYSLAAHPNMIKWKTQKLVITGIKTSQKVVALTFDDGPDPDNTPVLLDVLKKHKAQATFFVIGTKGEKYPSILKRIAREGHEIGNHGYTHFSGKNRQDEYLQYEIRKANEIIHQITGQKPRLFRPPGGYLSNSLIEITQKEKVVIAYWSYIQDVKDWRGISANSISRHIIENIKPGQVIILHDGSPNGLQTAHAVDTLIEKLSQEGYRFVTMSKLIRMENKE
ncbi:MAG: polysaccharide deacetylase family protein [Syntrophomonadaceae bacterium]|jgi:peptidoglycan/xylan/chitin deacetylase (PgdA/CDA1 family)